MYRHIVLIKFKDDATEETKQKCLDGLRSLTQISDAQQVIVAENIQDLDTTYSHALIVDCVDKAAYDRYEEHPHHKDVIANAYRPAVGGRAICNVEF